ncbi:general stress protein CsbD [Mycolicibacterium flavescens]|uniref:General stress protein CsbD n=2 Tax=Mycolicibacterium flavescens TaxID=1776 RepID=A0A1E3RBV0_MYCFV|nr:general stress protein CsbD [Mycolicibacterium flavescens]
MVVSGICMTTSEPTGRNPTMSSNNSGPEEAVKGVVEGVKGKAKEVLGAVAGRDDLYREGQAQQDKAEAQRNAAEKEAEAESARAAAKTAEKRQQAEQQ